MRMRRHSRLLIVLALACSQWLVVAHAVAHPALAADLTCEVCLHSPGFSGALPPSTPAVPIPYAAGEAPPVAPAAPLRFVARDPDRIRGPPRLLA
jgi:hypothetical protein